MEIGICTFADVGTHPLSGEVISPHQRLKNLMEEIELADQAGLDVFALGEHHREDYAVSSPATVLAAAAVNTKNIKLSSGVTVLSSDDPVRVFQQYATVDLLSDGRAEIMAGRGSFIESFPLFGFDLDDYNELFSEKLKMLLEINKTEKLSWQGKHTQTFNDKGVYPRPYQNKLPVWIAVGGTPSSVIRAAKAGLPLIIAIIGGSPAQFVSLTELYRKTFTESGHDISKLQLGINSHTYIAENTKQALDEFYPPYSEVMNRIGRERGWQGLNRQQFEASAGPAGALLVGSPQQVIEKILYEYELFKHTRFLAQTSIGALPHKCAMKCIELLGNVVAPEIRKYTSR